MDEKWRVEQVPAQPGSLAVVTGANSGVGYETALALAKKGVRVVLACRNPDKAATQPNRRY
ncbi:MAG: SDR family NAD(P)-dependent oxidoreductase [Hymenobacter sp.]